MYIYNNSSLRANGIKGDGSKKIIDQKTQRKGSNYWSNISQKTFF